MLARTALALLTWLLAGPALAADPTVLRTAAVSDVSSFDPAVASDIYSAAVAGQILEPLYTYAYLARPVQVRPLTAAALPEVSADQRELTVKLRPGILFTDDPAFKGKPRELVAEDYVYSLKRHFDPRTRSTHYPTLAALKILGLDEMRQRALKPGAAFDYDSPVEGLQALDRYTLRIRVAEPSPRLVYALCSNLYSVAVAREVVEAQGEAFGQHPVGTGPYRLAQWRRGSLVVLERNPGFRDERYDEQPPAGAPARLKAEAAALQGRRLPLTDRVEVAVIPEDQPVWLSFLQGQLDLTAVPYPFVPVALPGGHPAPNLARMGIRAALSQRADVVVTYFNMEDPVVGGYTAEKVALRRAIALGYDNAEEIRLIRRGLALPAQSLVPPETYGYDPQMRSEMSAYDPARAQALLDLYGYTDHDGDGWRDQPDGRPLVLEFHTNKDLREFNELWQRRLNTLKLRVKFLMGEWADQQKAARAGQLMMWGLAWNAGVPDGSDFLKLGYGPAKGAENLSRFDLPAYNKLFAELDEMPDGSERLQRFAEANRLLLAYLPIKAHVHRIGATVLQPWVHGYQPHPFLRAFWKYLDVDATTPRPDAARR